MDAVNKCLNKLGQAINTETGEKLMEVFGPPNALTEGADILSRLLYGLSEVVIRGLLPDQVGGGLGGEFGYGANFENDVFMMHPYCWCGKNDGSCLYCLHGDHPDFDRLLQGKWGMENYREHQGHHYYDPPLFWHKASNFRVTWYKWIGRDMATNRDITTMELQQIFTECWESIPQEARDKAQAEHEHENTPEYLAEQRKLHEVMAKAIWDSIKTDDFQFRSF